MPTIIQNDSTRNEKGYNIDSDWYVIESFQRCNLSIILFSSEQSNSTLA